MGLLDAVNAAAAAAKKSAEQVKTTTTTAPSTTSASTSSSSSSSKVSTINPSKLVPSDPYAGTGLVPLSPSYVPPGSSPPVTYDMMKEVTQSPGNAPVVTITNLVTGEKTQEVIPTFIPPGSPVGTIAEQGKPETGIKPFTATIDEVESAISSYESQQIAVIEKQKASVVPSESYLLRGFSEPVYGSDVIKRYNELQNQIKNETSQYKYNLQVEAAKHGPGAKLFYTAGGYGVVEDFKYAPFGGYESYKSLMSEVKRDPGMAAAAGWTGQGLANIDVAYYRLTGQERKALETQMLSVYKTRQLDIGELNPLSEKSAWFSIVKAPSTMFATSYIGAAGIGAGATWGGSYFAGKGIEFSARSVQALKLVGYGAAVGMVGYDVGSSALSGDAGKALAKGVLGSGYVAAGFFGAEAGVSYATSHVGRSGLTLAESGFARGFAKANKLSVADVKANFVFLKTSSSLVETEKMFSQYHIDPLGGKSARVTVNAMTKDQRFFGVAAAKELESGEIGFAGRVFTATKGGKIYSTDIMGRNISPGVYNDSLIPFKSYGISSSGGYVSGMKGYGVLGTGEFSREANAITKYFTSSGIPGIGYEPGSVSPLSFWGKGFNLSKSGLNYFRVKEIGLVFTKTGGYSGSSMTFGSGSSLSLDSVFATKLKSSLAGFASMGVSASQPIIPRFSFGSLGALSGGLVSGSEMSFKQVSVPVSSKVSIPSLSTVKSPRYSMVDVSKKISITGGIKTPRFSTSTITTPVTVKTPRMDVVGVSDVGLVSESDLGQVRVPRFDVTTITTSKQVRVPRMSQAQITGLTQVKAPRFVTPAMPFIPRWPVIKTPVVPIVGLPEWDGYVPRRWSWSDDWFGTGYRFRKWRVPSVESLIPGGVKRMLKGGKKRWGY